MSKLATTILGVIERYAPFLYTSFMTWLTTRQSAKLKKLEEQLEYEKKLKDTIGKLDDSEHLDWVRSKSFRD